MSDTPEQRSAPAPGWYPDPKDSTRMRFWDGTQWTDRTSDAASAAAPSAGQLGAAPTSDSTYGTNPSDVPAPAEATDEPSLFGSVKGWKPVRRQRVDDQTALRKGALIGLGATAVAWVLLSGVQLFDSYYYPAPYFSFERIYPAAPVDQPLLSVALLIIPVVTGWLVARSATNSRAGLSVGAATGSVFVASVAVPLLAFAWWWVFSRWDGFGFGDLVQALLEIVVVAAFFALVAVPMGVIGWLIGRPRPLSVDATASLDLGQRVASDELILLLSGLRNQRVDRPEVSTLSVSLKFSPGWAVLLGVLLFPLGVLAVLAGQREETGTIIINESGRGSSTFQARGLFDEAACTRLEAFLIDYASDS